MFSAYNLNKVKQTKYKSIENIYEFIFKVLFVTNFLGFIFLLSIGNKFLFLALAYLIITIVMKTMHYLRYVNLISIWFHINVLTMSIVLTKVIGWDSGCWLFILALVFVNYFCAFDNKFLTYILAFFEMVVVIFLYLNTKDKILILEPWIYKTMYASSFLSTFSVIFRLLLFANIITSDGYKFLKKEHDKLENMSQHDQLTGLLNRRSMERLVKHTMKVEKNGDIKANKIVILGDIDDFKQINDTFGHHWGDKVIKDVSDVLRSTFRRDDLICRWGGEEFLIMLTDASIDFMYEISERLLKNVNFIKLPNNSHVTMTFGMVVCVNNTYNFNEIVKKADILLYKGKKNGKDRVEMEILK